MSIIVSRQIEKKERKKKNWCQCEKFQETSFPKISQAQMCP